MAHSALGQQLRGHSHPAGLKVSIHLRKTLSSESPLTWLVSCSDEMLAVRCPGRPNWHIPVAEKDPCLGVTARSALRSLLPWVTGHSSLGGDGHTICSLCAEARPSRRGLESLFLLLELGPFGAPGWLQALSMWRPRPQADLLPVTSQAQG